MPPKAEARMTETFLGEVRNAIRSNPVGTRPEAIATKLGMTPGIVNQAVRELVRTNKLLEPDLGRWKGWLQLDSEGSRPDPGEVAAHKPPSTIPMSPGESVGETLKKNSLEQQLKSMKRWVTVDDLSHGKRYGSKYDLIVRAEVINAFIHCKGSSSGTAKFLGVKDSMVGTIVYRDFDAIPREAYSVMTESLKAKRFIRNKKRREELKAERLKREARPKGKSTEKATSRGGAREGAGAPKGNNNAKKEQTGGWPKVREVLAEHTEELSHMEARLLRVEEALGLDMKSVAERVLNSPRAYGFEPRDWSEEARRRFIEDDKPLRIPRRKTFGGKARAAFRMLIFGE